MQWLHAWPGCGAGARPLQLPPLSLRSTAAACAARPPRPARAATCSCAVQPHWCRGRLAVACAAGGRRTCAVGCVAPPERAAPGSPSSRAELEGAYSRTIGDVLARPAGGEQHSGERHCDSGAAWSGSQPPREPGSDAAGPSYAPDAAQAEASSSGASPGATAEPAGEPQLSAEELLRRQRISQANKGRGTWNKGKKHSPETIRKIQEATRLAMRTAKVRANVRRSMATRSEDVRKRTGLALAQHYAHRRHALEQLLAGESPKTLQAVADGCASLPQPDEWGKLDPALLGADGQPELERIPPLSLLSPASLAALRPFLDGKLHRALPLLQSALGKLAKERERAAREEAAARRRAAAEEARAAAEQARASGVVSTSRSRAAEHRAAISDGVRRKWQDPEYRAKVIAAAKARTSSDGDGAERKRGSAAAQGKRAKAAPRETGGRQRRKVLREEAEASEAERRQAATKRRSVQKQAPQRVVASAVLSSSEAQAAGSDSDASSGSGSSSGSGQRRERKLRVAKQLVEELESMITTFSEQDLEDENSGVRQSVEEAQELVSRAKRRVQSLSAGSQRPSGLQCANGASLAELESALLVLNSDA